MQDPLKYEIATEKNSDRKITSYLKIMNLNHGDNGTYLCHGENEYGIDVAIMETLIYDKPEVNLNVVMPVGRDKIFFNWTTTDWNSPITDYFLSVSLCSVLVFPEILESLSGQIGKKSGKSFRGKTFSNTLCLNVYLYSRY